jgi:NTE family protein
MQMTPPVDNRALVLGGGGLVGIAWLVGVASGLAAEGFDLLGEQAPDTILGTSAGSIVGAFTARGRPFADQRDMCLADATADISTAAAGKLDFAFLLELFNTWNELPDNSPASLAQVGAGALKAATIDESMFVDSFVDTVGGPWPSAGYRCTAVDVATGELRTFDAVAGVEAARAIAASCSVPGIFPPVTIGEARYTDGGLRSGTSADLATGTRHVLVLAPIGSNTGDPFDAMAKRLLDAEQAGLEAAGSVVTTLLPDAEANAATLRTPLGRMDPDARQAGLDHGARQGRALAATLAGRW